MTVGLIVLVAIIISAVYQYKKKNQSKEKQEKDDEVENNFLERNQAREDSQMNIGGNVKVLCNWLTRNKMNFEIWNHIQESYFFFNSHNFLFVFQSFFSWWFLEKIFMFSPTQIISFHYNWSEKYGFY